jgi:hypothetical protein
MPRIAVAAALALLLAGCAGGKPQPLAKAPQQRAPQVQAPRHAVADPGEAVWHLRAGLNVAALSCRGRGRSGVAGAYGRVLSRHQALLAAAYAGEQRRHGKGLDRHLTAVYNRFSYQPSQAQFCTNAAAVAEEAARMDSAALSGQARRLLGRLD